MRNLGYGLPIGYISSIILLLIFIFSAQVAQGETIRKQKSVDALFDAPCARFQVPKELALAIARQESGFQPWVLNISGQPVHARTREEALRYARWALKAGRSFDVGLMQINSFWFRKYGWSLETVLEPANNVLIGVWILAQEIQRHGLNWKAVASYHTPLHRNPARGQAYARSVIMHIRKIIGEN